MTTQTVYGPRQGGAGVTALTRDSSLNLALGGEGTAMLIGPFPKGPVGTPVVHDNEDSYARRRKLDIFEEDQTPLCAAHFYEMAQGKGKLITTRIADGNEEAAELPLFDRLVDMNVRALAPDLLVNGAVGKILAATPGTWGGADINFGGTVASGAAAASGSVWTTGVATFPKDSLKGGVLIIGSDTRERTILSNTALGEVTVSGSFADLTLAASPTAYRIKKESVSFEGTRKECAIKLTDGRQNTAGRFGVEVYEDGDLYSNPWTDLDLDDDGESYWVDTIHTRLVAQNQHEVDAEVDSGFVGDPGLEWLKPANIAEIPAPGGVSSNIVIFNVFRYLRAVTAGADGYIARSAFVLGANAVPHIMTLTFTAPTTYTVTATDMNGDSLADSLPDGATTGPYAAPHDHLSGHRVTVGSTPFAVGDTITIYCRALPTDLPERGGYFYPDAFEDSGAGSKDVTRRYRIVRSLADRIYVGAGVDLAGIAVPPGAPFIEGTDAGTYDLTGAKTLKVELYVDGVISGAAFNEIIGATGAAPAAQTTAETIVDINAAIVAAPETRFEAYEVTDAAGLTYVGLRTTAAWGNYGPDCSIKVTDGSVNAELGIVPQTEEEGVTPTTGRIEFVQALNGGRDGHHDLASTDYTDETLDVVTSPLLELVDQNLGLIRFALPGIDSMTTQQQAMVFAKAAGMFFEAEVPTGTADENAARLAIFDGWTPNRHAAPVFPAYGDLETNPFGGHRAYSCTLAGAILGLESRMIVDWKGVHKAPAGPSYRLDPLFRRLETDAVDSPSPVRDDLLVPAGIRPVINKGGAIYLFGDEAPNYGHNGTVWIHKVWVLLHIVSEMRAGLFQYTYDPSDAALRGKIVSAVRALMKVHHRNGWFKGTGAFDSDVKVFSTLANNPPEIQAIGKTVVGMDFEVVETNKNTEVQIGTKGIAVGLG